MGVIIIIIVEFGYVTFPLRIIGVFDTIRYKFDYNPLTISSNNEVELFHYIFSIANTWGYLAVFDPFKLQE